MDTSAATIPTIDISYLTDKFKHDGADFTNFTADDAKIGQLLNEVVQALSTWGFLYLKGHSLPSSTIKKCFAEVDRFFHLESQDKLQLTRDKEYNFGYVPVNMETFEADRPPDLKECFNFLPDSHRDELMAKSHPEFWKVGNQMYKECVQLAEVLFRLLDLALGMADQSFLLDQHKLWGSYKTNATTLRLLYYPPISSKESILDRQLRCGEHSDYGTMTFLFQDQEKGLQVLSPDGEYIFAEPKEDCIVVNIGDMFERWSAGKFRSTRHRVLIPTDISKPRRSIAFFIHPDHHVDVSCLDGSDKYPTVNCLQYLLGKFSDTYG